VLYDFGAENTNELTVQANEMVTVMRKVNADWWIVRNQSNQSGMVPCTFLTDKLKPVGLQAQESVNIFDDSFSESAQGSPMMFRDSPLNEVKSGSNVDVGLVVPKRMTSALEMAYQRTDSTDNMPTVDMIPPPNLTDEERKRFEAIREMLMTEKKYVEDLRTIIEVIFNIYKYL
jgi:hypothetical protein